MNQTKQTQSNRTLRRQLREQREQLSDKAQTIAEQRLAKRLGNYPALLTAQKVASYLPFNGEISPRLVEAALPHATVYYPRITNFLRREMRFYQTRQQNKKNALGINEPTAIGSPVATGYFDAILLPLVAFDRTGNRLGMGAGFYDRVLSYRLNSRRYPRPRLIGLAHHFQEVKSLTAQNWDVPLDAILTDVELIKHFSR